MVFKLREQERYLHYQFDNVVPKRVHISLKNVYCLKENGSNRLGKRAR